MGEIKDLVFDYAKMGFMYGFLFAHESIREEFNKFLEEQDNDFFLRVKEAVIEEIRKKQNNIK